MFNLFDNQNTTDFQFLLDQIGSDVTINAATPVKAIITNTTLNQNFDDRKISTLSPLQRGDIVIFNGIKYMIINAINDKRYNKYKGIMRRLTHSIIVNSSCRFFSLDSFIITSNLGVIDGQVLALSDGEIHVYFSHYCVNSDLKIGDRFLLDGQAFKVTGIDTFSKQGIVILTCDKDQINPATDDVEHEIAGGYACPVNIANDTTTVYVGSTMQLTWTSTDDAPVVFESSNPDVATVDAQGLVTGVGEGIATITIQNATNEFITDSVTVTVEEVPEVKTITLTPNTMPIDEIKAGQSKTYTATVYQGATSTDDLVNWSLYGDDQMSSTTLATITAQDGTTCTIKANSNQQYGYIQLKAELIDDPSVFVWQRIRIRSLF